MVNPLNVIVPVAALETPATMALTAWLGVIAEVAQVEPVDVAPTMFES